VIVGRNEDRGRKKNLTSSVLDSGSMDPKSISKISLESLVANQGYVSEDFEIHHLLSHHPFGSKFIAKAKKLDNKLVFITVMANIEEEGKIDIAKALYLLQTSHHPNIVQLLSSYIMPDEVSFVYEFLDGLTAFGCLAALSENQVSFICIRVLNALGYFHGLGRIHRDIRSSHIILTIDGEVKLSK
jgi:serine/threonine protein kinase